MKYYDIQEAVNLFRRKRLVDLKRMFPSLPKKQLGLPRISTAWLETTNASRQENKEVAKRANNSSHKKIESTVSKKIQGLSNAEIIEVVRHFRIDIIAVLIYMIIRAFDIVLLIPLDKP
jgi:hypothetical protein